MYKLKVEIESSILMSEMLGLSPSKASVGKLFCSRARINDILCLAGQIKNIQL